MISPDQVTALAPDAASYKAGKALAVASKWSDLARDDQMFWGLAKGSGKKPYLTCVSVDDFVSKCSCPSRKFPCKHALGLMFIAAQDLSFLAEADLPDWVQEWKDSRAARVEKAGKKKQTAKPKSEESAARTKKKRTARMDDGIKFLDEFLLDLIRQGLAQSSVSDYDTWDNAARRLIDFQAPGLARYIRRLEEIAHSGPNWESRLLHEMGSLYLLSYSYKQRDNLDSTLCAEIEQRIGWQVEKESVLSGKTMHDDWFVAYRTVTTADKLKVFSNWVYGQKNRQWALLLSFSAGGAAPAALWPVGGTVITELAFYPGASDERALAVVDSAPVRLGAELNAEPESVQQLLGRVSDSLAVNPWRSRFPGLIHAQPATLDGAAVLVDDQGDALPWQHSGDDQMIVQTVCGGRATVLAGEWNGHAYQVHAALDNGDWFQLREQFQ